MIDFLFGKALQRRRTWQAYEDKAFYLVMTRLLTGYLTATEITRQPIYFVNQYIYQFITCWSNMISLYR